MYTWLLTSEENRWLGNQLAFTCDYGEMKDGITQIYFINFWLPVLIFLASCEMLLTLDLIVS